MKLLIKNGRLLNPATKTDEVLDVLICDGKIKLIDRNIELHPHIKASKETTDTNVSSEESALHQDRIIDAAGCLVMPGLIDLHVHLRDPGLTYKEDMKTGSEAAARGGYTTIVAMANTKPVIDSVERWQEAMARAKEVAPIEVIQVSSLTKGMQGEELVPLRNLKAAGLSVVSEDGRSVMNAKTYMDAMEICAEEDLLVLDHCEDEDMKGKGVFHTNAAKRLGVGAIPNVVEDVMIARDLLIAKHTGTRLHICHCSTRDSVQFMRWAKDAGMRASAEVCPHHFILTDDDIPTGDSNYKMAPPLREQGDIDALIQGLKDGAIDCIASDHAPHAPEEKGSDLGKAAFGIVGSETMVPLSYTHLVKAGHLTPLELAKVMSYNPAQILGIDKGDLSIGKSADITIIDPEAKYTIDKETFASKGRNTPFDGKEVYGKVKATIFEGRIVYEN